MDEVGVSLWAIAVIGGPVVLAAAPGYAVVRARLRRRRAAAANRGMPAAARPQEGQRR
jgi:hypothetical protein